MKIQRLLLPLGMVASLAIAAACGSTTPTTETPGDTTGTGETAPSSSTPTPVDTGVPTPTTTSTPTPPTSSSASTPAAAQKWEDLKNDGERAAFMGKVIVPAMKPLFAEFDATKFGKFGCETCHGPNRKKPTEFLPKLTLAGGKFKTAPDKAKMLQFMMEKVTPEMAKAMGEKPYDPATKTGFGCGECHVIDMK